jgi:hypothetical protein
VGENDDNLINAKADRKGDSEMYIAQIIERSSQALVSFGEGLSEGEARMNAVYNIPQENEDVLECECEWVVDLVE